MNYIRCRRCDQIHRINFPCVLSPPPAAAASSSSFLTTTSRDHAIDLTTSPTNDKEALDESKDNKIVIDDDDEEEDSSAEVMDVDVADGERKMPFRVATAGTASTVTQSNTTSTDEDEALQDEESDDEAEVIECWQCPRCTFINPSALSYCDVCYGIRPTQANQQHQQAAAAAFSRQLPSPPPFASRFPQVTSTTRDFPPRTNTGSTAFIHRLHQKALLEFERQRSMELHQHGLRLRGAQLYAQQRQALERLRQVQRQQEALAPQTRFVFGPSRSPSSLQRYLTAVHAIRSARLNDIPSTTGMNFDQLLQAFGDGTENMGASDSDINQLPVYTVIDPAKNLPEGLRTCNICLEDFVAGDERRTLPCLHGYHKECSDKWLKTNGSCPVCKHSIRP